MQFRDLGAQYRALKPEIDAAIAGTLESTDFISGRAVAEFERQMESYVGVKHCITCANGTDALLLALMAWGIGPGDAVFVPDFTFFASAEVVVAVGATPVFVDVSEDTFNISPESLEDAVKKVLKEGIWKPRVVIAVDLFGLPADYREICRITKQYGLYVLEDGAQGFGGSLKGKKACSFGDIGTTSFFPAKPLGCYGDGGAVFTDNEEWADSIRSLCVHGKGQDKYDNVRIGMNSRLDTIQAAILGVKLAAFQKYELERVNLAARKYTELLDGLDCQVPSVPEGMVSSWAQYTVRLKDEETRNRVQKGLGEKGIPSIIYYKRGMHMQGAFKHVKVYTDLSHSMNLSRMVLSLPMHPYLEGREQEEVCSAIKEVLHGDIR